MTAPMKAEIKQEKVHGFIVDALRSETDIAIAVLDMLNIGDDKNIVVKDAVQIDRAEYKNGGVSFYNITSFKAVPLE